MSDPGAWQAVSERQPTLAHLNAGAAAVEVLAGIRTVRAFSQETAEGVRHEDAVLRATTPGLAPVSVSDWNDGVAQTRRLQVLVGAGLVSAEEAARLTS